MSILSSIVPTGIGETARAGADRQANPMFDLEEAIKLVPAQTVLCIGDLMLDDFVYGDISRISPEAPVPVIAVRREERVIGGAGNVARNIAGLGATCMFIGVVGDDDAGRALADVFGKSNGIDPHLIVD